MTEDDLFIVVLVVFGCVAAALTFPSAMAEEAEERAACRAMFVHAKTFPDTLRVVDVYPLCRGVMMRQYRDSVKARKEAT